MGHLTFEGGGRGVEKILKIVLDKFYIMHRFLTALFINS